MTTEGVWLIIHDKKFDPHVEEFDNYEDAETNYQKLYAGANATVYLTKVIKFKELVKVERVIAEYDNKETILE